MRIVLFLLLLLLLSLTVLAYHVKGRPIGKLETSAECFVCIAAAAPLAQIAKMSASEDAILYFAKVMCKLFAHEPYTVCDGIIEQFRGEFFYVFRQLADEPSRICAALIPECGDALDPRGEGWQVKLPLPLVSAKVGGGEKRVEDVRPPSVLRVLHITDTHVDFLYQEGSEAECEDPVCCRGSSKGERGVKRTLTAGYWGTVGKCDIPYRTLHHLLSHVNRTERIDYIMVSGDLINHVDWTYSWNTTVQAMRNMTSLFKHFFPFTPIYWALGNHEGVPVNSFPTHNVKKEFWPTQLYEELSEMNSPWVDGEAAKRSTKYRGSWSAKVMKGLTLISINTGYCINTNMFLYLNQSDPDGTMSWFVNELYEAEKAGDAVHVVAHIPPGYYDCLEGWSRNYYRTVQRFSSTIKAQYFGHVHWDYFTLFYSDMKNISSEAVGVAYVSPSSTTFDYLNPAYRIYSIHAENFEVLNFDTYSTDLKKTSKEKEPVWSLLYNARDEFNMTDLSAASWNKVAKDILSSPAMQERFVQLSFRTAEPNCEVKSCREYLMCLLRSGHHDDSLYCPPSMRTTNRIH